MKTSANRSNAVYSLLSAALVNCTVSKRTLDSYDSCSPQCVASCGGDSVDPQSGQYYSCTSFRCNGDLRIHWYIPSLFDSSLPLHLTPNYSLSENRIPDAGVSLAGALRVNRSLDNLE